MNIEKGSIGYDVSHHNPVNSATLVVNKGRFCFVKATEGVGYKDPNFKINMTGWLQSGYHIGAYHFVRLDSDNKPEAEMACFMEAVMAYLNNNNIEMLALDIEGASLNKSGSEEWMNAAVAHLRKLTSLPIYIYVQGSAVKRFEFLCNNYPDVAIWLADWSSSDLESSARRFGFNSNNVVFWQTGSTKLTTGQLIDYNKCVKNVGNSVNVSNILDRIEEAFADFHTKLVNIVSVMKGE